MKRVLVCTAALLITCSTLAETFTVATFSDPSDSSEAWLFEVDWPNSNGGTVKGGWNAPGLTLEFGSFFGGSEFQNVWFEMTDLTITDTIQFYGKTFGVTGQGVINFYEEGMATNPLLTIAFEQAHVATFALAADESVENDIWAENVVFSGSQIGQPLFDQSFAFSFSNVEGLNGDAETDGFTATAAFTSSAVPEPMTVVLLSIGGGMTLLRKRK